MQFYILDKDPFVSASKIPDKYKFKMLLELAQLVSTLTNSVYKPIRQGIALRDFINEHKAYTKAYYKYLLDWAEKNVKMKEKTHSDLIQIYESIQDDEEIIPVYAYFRFSKDYCNEVSVENNTKLPIEECIIEYNKYIEWKIKKDFK